MYVEFIRSGPTSVIIIMLNIIIITKPAERPASPRLQISTDSVRAHIHRQTDRQTNTHTQTNKQTFRKYILVYLYKTQNSI